MELGMGDMMEVEYMDEMGAIDRGGVYRWGVGDMGGGRGYDIFFEMGVGKKGRLGLEMEGGYHTLYQLCKDFFSKCFCAMKPSLGKYGSKISSCHFTTCQNNMKISKLL